MNSAHGKYIQNHYLLSVHLNAYICVHVYSVFAAY